MRALDALVNERESVESTEVHKLGWMAYVLPS